MTDRVQINNTRWYWRNCPSGVEITTEDYPMGDYLFLDLGQIRSIFADGLSEWVSLTPDLRRILKEHDAGRE